MTRSNDIPIEGAVKWLLKDRDKYKAKLEQLIPYTKTLEKKCRRLEEKNKLLIEKLDKAHREIMQTPLYKEVFRKYRLLLDENNALISKLALYEDKLKTN